MLTEGTSEVKPLSPAGRNPTRGILSAGHDCTGNARLMVERVTWQETWPSGSCARFAHVVFIPSWRNVWKARPSLVVLCSLLRCSTGILKKYSARKWKKVGRKEEEFRARLERRYHGVKSETRRDETRGEERRGERLE